MPKYSYGKDGDESSVGFGGTKPKQTKSKAAKTFNQLVRSIYRSTIMAQRKVDEQVVEHFLERFFDKDGHPNLFRLSLPTHDGAPVEVDVPLITLTHGNHLNIKELEIDFEVELARSLNAGPLKTSSKAHIALTSKNLPGKVQYRQSVNPSVDGNTVELAVEQMEFSENITRYQTTLTFLNNRISGLMSAIRGE